jgi:hypothetical protein
VENTQKNIVEDATRIYLHQAENMFGSKIDDWSFCGVEFNDTFPHLRYYNDTGEVKISLRNSSIENNIQFHFQLSHEICHLLYPTTDVTSGAFEQPTVLNEGISTIFSIMAVKNIDPENDIVGNIKEHNPNYYNAMLDVEELLKIDYEAIKKVRVHQPYLNKITKKDFKKAELSVPKDLLNRLLETFTY